jgi:beta-lactamase class A
MKVDRCTLDRRTFLAAAPALLAWPALAQSPLSPLMAYERQSGGRVGLYAHNIETGATIAWRADERFVMCSTFKASLAACVLTRVDRGQDRLEDLISYGAGDIAEYAPAARANLARGALSVEEMCKAAVELSDNTCANLLLARIGGPPAMTAFWRATSDGVSRLDHNEPLLNRSPPGDPHDTTTPAAMVGNFRRFVFGDLLSAASRERFTAWLIGCQTGDNRLRAGLPKIWTIGDKTGNNGKDAAGDIAVAWRKPPGGRLLICAYTQGGAPTAAQIDRVFAEIGPLVTARL